MKMKKTVAAVLALAFAVSAAGCSKVKSVSGEDVVNVCEDRDYEEVDDIYDIEEEMLEDGFYFVADRDYIEDNLPSQAAPYLRMTGLDLGIDIDDVEEITLFGQWRTDNIDDVEDPEDLEDVEIEFVAGVQITLEDYDAETLDDIVDGIDDLLREANVDIDDLSSSEFRQTNNSAYLKLGIDVADFMEAFLGSEFWEAACDNSDDDDEVEEVEEAFSALTGKAGVEILVADGNILIVAAGNLNCEAELSRDVCSALNIDDPARFPHSELLTEGIMELLNDFSGLMSTSADDLLEYGF